MALGTAIKGEGQECKHEWEVRILPSLDYANVNRVAGGRGLAGVKLNSHAHKFFYIIV